MKPRLAHFGVAVWLTSALVTINAAGLDPTRSQRIAVGAPSAATNSASGVFPKRPRVRARAAVADGVGSGVSVDSSGRVIVATQGQDVVQLDSSGQRDWATDVGATPATRPVVSAGGTRLVVTEKPELVALTPGGKVLFKRRFARRHGQFGPIRSLTDGSVVVARGKYLARFDRSGRTRDETELSSDVAAIIDQPSGLLLVARNGDIFRWNSPAPPSRYGSFGMSLSSGVVDKPGELYAVAGRRRILRFEFRGRLRTTLVPRSNLRFASTPTLSSTGDLFIATDSGLLLGYDSNGDEQLRVTGGAIRPRPKPGGTPRLDLGSSTVSRLPPIVDAAGNIAYMYTDAELIVVTPAGDSQRAAGASCRMPAALLAAPKGELVAACRSGRIFFVANSAK